MSDLSRGTYSGQFAFVYIEPKTNPGQYDQEFFLATHEWEPFFTTAEEEEEELDAEQRARMAAEKKDEKPNGWEIGYQRFTINGKCLGFGEPLRVKEGQRVLFHILNASATENIQLALPGHVFQVIALDGNPVPHPQPVEVLELGTAERISAVVEMKNPGVWILGTPKDDDRMNGMGIVVEYANKTGQPRWIKPPKKRWDYSIFGETPPPCKIRTKPFRWLSAKSTAAPAASIIGPSTASSTTTALNHRSCTKAAATAWCSTTRPTTPTPCTCIATASN